MKLVLKNVGQLEEAAIDTGDLTVLVGPQASGKSIFLQFLKLVEDMGTVVKDIRRTGISWKDHREFLDLYLGEGMRNVWRSGEARTSQILLNGNPLELEQRLRSAGKGRASEKVFFIPAQRVLTLRNGWPRNFSDFSAGDPYVVRAFSENLRLQMESGLGRGEGIFPEKGRLKKDIRDRIGETIFRGFALKLDRQGPQKRLVLQGSESTLPFMVWSAGQREFVPLLLGLYWLLPPGGFNRTREGVEWVVIEELEMGLHPDAIWAVMLLVLDLLHRGYRVVLSTHSNQVLEVLWVLNALKNNGAEPAKVLQLFGVRNTGPMKQLAETVLSKTYRVFYFRGREKPNALDISKLDPGADSSNESGWGGLTQYSSKAADIVSEAVGRHAR